MPYYRDVPGQIIYTHRYRCGCTKAGLNWLQGWITEDSQSPNPRPRSHQHFQLDQKSGCQRYLRHASTTQRRGTVKEEIACEEMEWGLLKLCEDTRTSNVPTNAIMWCGETKKWHSGKCRHGLTAPNSVPHGISEAITLEDKDKQVDNDCYGANRAEVQCVFKAYEAGRKGADLTGCRFMARNQSVGGISACKSCRVWIKKLKGVYADFAQGTFSKWV